MSLAARLARLEARPEVGGRARFDPGYPPETILDTSEDIDAATRLLEWSRNRKYPDEPVPPELLPDVERLGAWSARHAYCATHEALGRRGG